MFSRASLCLFVHKHVPGVYLRYARNKRLLRFLDKLNFIFSSFCEVVGPPHGPVKTDFELVWMDALRITDDNGYETSRPRQMIA